MDIYQIQSHKRYIDSHMSKEMLHSYEILVISWMNLVIYFYSQKLKREVVIKFTQTRIFCERNPDQTKGGPTVDG